MDGQIDTKNISMYQPSADVASFTKKVKEDYSIGTEILNKPWVELNDRSVVDDENRGQKMFNAHVDTDIEDPNRAWEWRGTRSMARNKAIAMHANLTANYLLPMFDAQNEDDQVDRDFSEFMRDVIVWMTSPTVSNYQSSFLQVAFGMLTNPVTYLGAEYCEVMQTIKIKQEDGRYTKKEIVDEVLSGFNAPIWSSTQVLITNPHERNIQKQRGIIKRRYVEKSELEAKYGDHPNWVFVNPGIRSIYNEEDGLFYDVKDVEVTQNNLVIEETPMYRRDDVEACLINGIYFGNENIDDNPIHHRDINGAPKYDVTPFGYSRIGEHFFYYKSLMNCLGWDNMLYDAMSEVVMNRAFLEVNMPLAISGSDKIDSEVVFPNSVVTFENPDAKVTPLLPNSNMAAGFNALQATEQSISEGSVNETVMGQVPSGSQRAYVVAQAQANAKKLIAAVGKSLGESVAQYGDLMKDIVLNNITVPQLEELGGDSTRLKYRSFIVPDKNGTQKTIKLDAKLIGKDMTDEEKKIYSLKLLSESGYPDNKNVLTLINPEMVARFKYLTKVDPEEMFAKNSEYWQPILLNLKTALAKDTYTNQEELTRELMYSYFQSRGDKFVQKPSAQPIAPGANPQNNQYGNQVNQKVLSTASTNAAVS